jgi:cation diffusion facilitator family transporter
MSTETFKKIKTVLWIILFANFLVALIKIIFGSLISSNSLTADGIHSLTDGSSNIVGLIGIHIAARPVDEDHPYGHKKFETLAGLFIGGMLLFLGSHIITTAISRFIHPIATNVTLESLVALIFTLAINLFVSRYELREGLRLKSDILISDSYHTRSDVYVSIGVLVALTAIKLGLPAVVDPIVSVIVAGFIFHASYEILRPALGVLADKAAVEPEQIYKIVAGFEQIKNVHKIRSRGRVDDIQIDLHVMIDPEMSVEESHKLMHEIQKKIDQELDCQVQTVIHVEPFEEDHQC